MARNAKAAAAKEAAPGAKESDRRRTIQRAAIDVFARKGYHGCRIADVAKEAGVAYGLVYHYFQNKEELLQSVFEASWRGFLQRIGEAAKVEGPLEEKIQAIVSLAFEAYRTDPKAVKVLIVEIGRSPGLGRVSRQTAFTQILDLAAQMFARAQQAGELASGLNPLLCAALLFGAIEMGLTAFVVGMFDRRDEAALQAARDQVAQTFLRGVLPKAATPPAEDEWTSDSSDTRSRATRRS